MEEDCNENNLEVENLQLIDISSEDDFLIASSLGDSLEDFRFSVMLENIDEGYKLFGTADSREAENAAEILKQREQKLSLSESTESGRANNLRESLAWDSAFFTSAGVLEPEELFIINKGFEKAEAHLLPVIQEDLNKRRSVDSESTLDSDGFSFDSNQSTEFNLFEDIRASIQRSCIMSNVFKSGCKSGVGEACKQKTHSSKKLHVVSRNRVKSLPTCSRQSIGMQGSQRINEVVIHPQILQHDERYGEADSLKQPKILGRMNLVPAGQTRKVSLGADHMGNKTIMSGSGKGLIVSKESGSWNSCSTSSTTTPKSFSSVSVATSNDSRASCSSSGSASSCTSSSNSRTRTDSRKIRFAASGSTSKTPLRCSLGGKSRLGNHGLSTNLLSVSNHSSCDSPSSSIDGWSSGSSSTSANQRSTCSEPIFYTSTPRGVCLGNDATQALEYQEIHQTRLPNQCIEAVRGTGNASAESTRNFRPSGLRMPSPKIGFFDEEKPMVVTASGGLQFHFGAHSALPNINGATNRKRPGKRQSSRISSENGDTNPGYEQTGVLYPALSTRNQQLDKNSPKVSTSSATLRKFPGKASKGQADTSPQLCREICSKSRKVGDGGHGTTKLGLHSNLKAESKRTGGTLRNEMSRERKGDVCLKASKIHPSKDEPIAHTEEPNPAKEEQKRASRQTLENEKENVPSFEDDHINGLSRYFEVIDLSRDMVMELKGKRGCFHPQFGDNFSESTVDEAAEKVSNSPLHSIGD